METPTVTISSAPRYRIDPLAAVDTSDAVREFLESTEGLTTRMPFPGIGDMRASKRVCVHALLTRFLFAGRLAGLPRSWAERLILFIQNEADRAWGIELPALRSARRAAAIAEGRENVAEIEAAAAHPDNEAEYAALCEEESAVLADIAADRVRVMAIQKRKRQLRGEGEGSR